MSSPKEHFLDTIKRVKAPRWSNFSAQMTDFPDETDKTEKLVWRCPHKNEWPRRSKPEMFVASIQELEACGFEIDIEEGDRMDEFDIPHYERTIYLFT